MVSIMLKVVRMVSIMLKVDGQYHVRLGWSASC